MFQWTSHCFKQRNSPVLSTSSKRAQVILWYSDWLFKVVFWRSTCVRSKKRLLTVKMEYFFVAAHAHTHTPTTFNYLPILYTYEKTCVCVKITKSNNVLHWNTERLILWGFFTLQCRIQQTSKGSVGQFEMLCVMCTGLLWWPKDNYWQYANECVAMHGGMVNIPLPTPRYEFLYFLCLIIFWGLGLSTRQVDWAQRPLSCGLGENTESVKHLVFS